MREKNGHLEIVIGLQFQISLWSFEMLLFNMVQDLSKFLLLPKYGQKFFLWKKLLEPALGGEYVLWYFYKLEMKRKSIIFLFFLWTGQKPICPFSRV